MALAKSKTKNKNLINKIIIGALVLSNIFTICVASKSNKSLSSDNAVMQKKIMTTDKTISSLREDIKKLNEELSIRLSSESDLRLIRGDLIHKINEVVSSKNKKISEVDVLRALNSTEERIMDEYIRVASLILATMETESNFRYITCTNNNGTKDYGIMQVNDAIIPHAKEALGDNIDPINNKNHNVKAGSWEIYECYLKAKDKHPEDVIWWTYAYYNRGMYFEGQDQWKNPNNPNYKKVHKQANERSNKFKEYYNSYHEALSAIK